MTASWLAWVVWAGLFGGDGSVNVRQYLVTLPEQVLERICREFELGQAGENGFDGRLLSARRTFELLEAIQNERRANIVTAPFPFAVRAQEFSWLPMSVFTERKLGLAPVAILGRSSPQFAESANAAAGSLAFVQLFATPADRNTEALTIPEQPFPISQAFPYRQVSNRLVAIPNGHTLVLDGGKCQGTKDENQRRLLLLTVELVFDSQLGK